MAEPPYGIIADELTGGNVIPFLGADASLSGRPLDAHWEPRTAAFLPSFAELAEQLAEDASFPTSDANENRDLSRVSSYYADQAGDRASLRSYLRKTFNRDYAPGAVHHFLAQLDVPLLIVTTNYDDLIERAFRERDKPFHLVAYPTDNLDLAASLLWWKPGAAEPEFHLPNTLPLSLTNTTIIYKMHGTVDRQNSRWDSFVVTEEDYVEFLKRMMEKTAIPARFMVEFQQRHFLYLGYGLRDWNFRVMFKTLRAGYSAGEIGGPLGLVLRANPTAVGGMPDPSQTRSWAIQRHPSELEAKLWEKRNVSLFDVEMDTFIEKLRSRTS